MKNKILILFLGIFLLVGSFGFISAEKMWNYNNHSLNVSHNVLSGGFVNATTDLCIVGGNCLSSVGSGSLTGAGTAMRIPLWNGTTSLNNSNIYQGANGNIGIGVASPDVALEVNGAIHTSRLGTYGTYSAAEVQGIWSISEGYPINTVSDNFGTQYGLGYAYNQNGGSPLASEHQIVFTGNGVSNAAIGLTYGTGYFKGNLGVGTATPTSKAHIYGDNITLQSADAVGFTDFNILDNSGSIAGFRIRYNDAGGETYLDNLYDNAAGDLYIRTKAAGTPVNALFIESAGNVGIGTTSPGSYKLNVAGTINAYEVLVNGSAISGGGGLSGAGTAMQVPLWNGTTSLNNSNIYQGANGYIGLGTVPSYPLHLSTSANAPQAYFTSTGTSTRIGINHATNTGFGLYTGGTIRFSTAVYQAGSGNLDFAVYNDQTSTASIFIDGSTNYVGLGDSSPNQKLGLFGTNAQISIEESDTEFLRLGAGETAHTSIIGWDDADKLYLGVYSSPTDTTIDTKMTIQSDGNVGIGTTTPSSSYKLDVAGNINAYQVLVNGSAISGGGGYWAASGLNLYNDTTGVKVGIGIAIPESNLHIRQDQDGFTKLIISNEAALGNTNAIAGLVVAGRAGSGNFNIYGSDHVTTAFQDTLGITSGTNVPSGIFLRAAAGSAPIKFYTGGAYLSEQMILSGTGNLGIGTSSPGAPLSFGTALGNKTFLYENGAITYGFGLQSNLLQIFADTSSDRVGIGYGDSSAFTETLTVKGANVGIGTTSPSTKLDVAGTVNATTFSSTSGTGSPLRIAFPGGAAYATNVGTVNGAIKITLPVNNPSTMLTMTVKIYNYVGDQSYTINLGGYPYSAGGWHSTFANVFSSTGANLTVRFGNDGTNECIYIGEVGSSWTYPQVFVTDFQAGYSNYAVDTWDDGWSVGFITSFAGQTIETTATSAYFWNSANYAGSSGGGSVADVWVNTTGDTMTGPLVMGNGAYLNLNRGAGVQTGIQWYNSGFNAWTDYMAPAGAGQGPKGTITAPSGSLVTSWAQRSFIENSANYGWTFESGTSSSTTPTVVAEIRASDGSARFAGDLTVAGGDIIGANSKSIDIGEQTSTDITFKGSEDAILRLDGGYTEFIVPSLFQLNNGLYVSSGTTYIQSALVQRGYIINDGTDYGGAVYVNDALTVEGIVNIVSAGADAIPALTVARVTGELWGGSGGGDRGFLRLSAGGGTALGQKAAIDIQGYSTTSGDASLIRFLTGGNNERMRINSAGNIGVGTSSPQAGMRMDVRSDAATAGSSGITAYGYNGAEGKAIQGYGYATTGTGNNYGIYGISGGPRAGGTNIGGYFTASGAATNYALITGSGNVGIGTTGPASKLHVIDTGTQLRLGYDSAGYVTFTVGSTGVLTITNQDSGTTTEDIQIGTTSITNAIFIDESTQAVGIKLSSVSSSYSFEVGGAEGMGAQAYYYTSDERLKENIFVMEDGLEKIRKLEGVTFDWKEGGKKSMGLIAQDVEKVFPDMVTTADNGMKSVQYGNFVAPLIESVKTLADQDDEQYKEIEELRKEIEMLKLEINNLKK